MSKVVDLEEQVSYKKESASSYSDEENPKAHQEEEPQPKIQAEPEVGSLCLEFKDVTYKVEVGSGSLMENLKQGKSPWAKTKKEILHQISGRFAPGRLVALMGTSGTFPSCVLFQFWIYLILQCLLGEQVQGRPP